MATHAVHGVGRVGFAADEAGATRLKDLYQRDPVRLLFPTPPRNEIQSAVIVTTSGGLVGGDVLSLSAQADEDVAAQLYPQAAEKVYRSAGADCRIAVDLGVARGAWLEWLPQECILFDGARLRRRTRVDAAAGARVLAGEMMVLGRRAMGERLATGLVREDWEVRRDGRLIWADSLVLDDDIPAIIDHPAGLNGATALGTVIYLADDGPDLRDDARALLDGLDAPGVRHGATVVNGLLIVRFMAESPLALRRAYGGFWGAFRQAVAGLPAALPRLWHI
ncbi:MAG: urease accessory protein UreD [Rhodobacterales bacterium]|nr:urease accessory protein UreD [Rhodobacterales bacterium]